MGKQKLTRKEQAQETRLLVFHTALQLLEERPFEEITIRDIVSRAGVSIGTFYNYFESKLDVFYETYAIADEYFRNEVAPQLTQPCLYDRLLYFFDCYAAYSCETTGLKMTKVLYNSSNTRFLRTEDNGMLRVLLDVLKRGAEDGEISLQEVESTARHLFIAARGLVYDWCLHDGDYPLREEMAAYLGRLTDGIGLKRTDK